MPPRLGPAHVPGKRFLVRHGELECSYGEAREAIVEAVREVRGPGSNRAEVIAQTSRRFRRPRESRVVTLTLGPNGLVAATPNVFTSHPPEHDAAAIAEHVLGYHQRVRCPSREGPCC